jgi:hypothetical protein
MMTRVAVVVAVALSGSATVHQTYARDGRRAAPFVVAHQGALQATSIDRSLVLAAKAPAFVVLVTRLATETPSLVRSMMSYPGGAESGSSNRLPSFQSAQPATLVAGLIL